jgi:hypothetical protein
MAEQARANWWEAGWRRKFNAYRQAYQMATERGVLFPFFNEITIAEYRLHCAAGRKKQE